MIDIFGIIIKDLIDLASFVILYPVGYEKHLVVQVSDSVLLGVYRFLAFIPYIFFHELNHHGHR